MILLRPTFGFSEMFTEVNHSGNIQEFKTSLYRKFEEEEKADLDLPEGGGGDWSISTLVMQYKDI